MFKNIFKALKAGAFLALLAYAAALFALPDELHMKTGGVSRFSSPLPIFATITPESAEVIRVDGSPVTQNITINLRDGADIEAAGEGQARLDINLFGRPLKSVPIQVSERAMLIPCGMCFGVRLNTSGVMVLGTGEVQTAAGSVRPAGDCLRSGDLILSVNGRPLTRKDELISAVEGSSGDITLSVRRDGLELTERLSPAVDWADNRRKIGVWVRDAAQGIGTITYLNPAGGGFGALGHGIADVDTRRLLPVKDGEVYRAEITSVKMGRKGAPGELIGNIKKQSIIGTVEKNSEYGVFGRVYGVSAGRAPLPVAAPDEVHDGPARILSSVYGDSPREYDVYIESVNRFSGDRMKSMVVRVTDPDLLKRTGGIVQGMSGSPIIQDGRLAGALTHVFVREPEKGYGIFAADMLKAEGNGFL
ncbi:MAG: SpoIVB peptidase [Clostridiales bacterium]|nr:SpoIVB peptidase [Clostridiales bacterium]